MLKLTRAFTAFSLATLAHTTTSHAAPSSTSPADPIDASVEKLLGQMTPAEKIGQLNQRHFFAEPRQLTYLDEAIRRGEIGSILNTDGPETVNALQRIAVEHSRLKIPLLAGLDVIHGYRTLFPIPIAQSCSWNPDLVQTAARISAREASTGGIRWTFAPMLDIPHDPRWGRIAETLGEDPFLASRFASAFVHGFQGPDLTDPTSLAACAKHFVGYGAAEGGRDYNTTQIPEPELRNLYLPPFKAARDAGALTFMSAFNDLNGLPATANPFILRQILRDEWDFRGFVVTDWQSIEQLRDHGLAADARHAALLSLRAGIDMEMVSFAFQDHALSLLATGELSPALIDDAVRRILRVKFQLGLFAHPYANPPAAVPLLAESSLQTARELATQSIVLHKNDHALLPLSTATKTIAIIGPLADSGIDMRGCWFAVGQPADSRTPLAALKEILPPDAHLLHAPGLALDTSTDTALFDVAVAAAQQADVVLLCLGEGHDLAGEARSRAFLELPGAQEKLFDAIAATGKPIVLVVFGGRPLVFEKPARTARAILYAWHPGTMAGPALCDLLFGRTAPSAKLTVTFPRTIGQIPLYYNHRNTGRPPKPEDPRDTLGTPRPFDGVYTSRYIDAPYSPAWPFGFGLTYTTFAYSDLAVAGPDASGAFTITATLANTGPRDGVEIAQLYTHDIAASLTRPVRELKGFQRIALKAGERRTIAFTLPAQSLGFYDSANHFVVEPGAFECWVGTDSTAPLHAEFILK